MNNEHMVKDKMIRSRIIGLDIFRIFLAAYVLAFHSNIHFQCYYGILDNFISMGAIAMTGFFMLSGFSLFYVYESDDMHALANVRRFYRKRLIGIMPSYYIIGLFYCFFCGTESPLQNLLLAPMEILGLQAAYPSTFGLTHNGGTWFISCMLMCYALFPFMKECVVQMGAKERLVLLGLLAGIMLYSPIAVWWFRLGGIYNNPFFRMLEFLIGVLLESHMKEISQIVWLRSMLYNKAVIVAEMVAMVLGVSFAYGLGIGKGNYMLYSWICMPLFSTMLIGLSGSGGVKQEQPWGGKAISYLSDICYAFFLVQLFIWPAMRKVTELAGIHNNIFKIVSSFIFCTAVATAIHEIIERPCRKWLNKLLKG